MIYQVINIVFSSLYTKKEECERVFERIVF
jgi:hypothetical protein